MASISFAGSHFEKEVQFGNRRFTDRTNFTNCTFATAPDFLGSTLHADTSFTGSKFPPDRIFYGGQKSAAACYRSLKKHFGEMANWHAELEFSIREMREESLALAFWSVKRVLFGTYWYFSRFGTSIGLPLFWLGFGLFVFAGAFSIQSEPNWCMHLDEYCKFSGSWLKFSLYNSVPFFGTDTLETIGFEGEIENMNGWSSVLFILQKFYSITMFFLIGLALRNQFKMK